jgi:polysaccharide biosynthesis transport protein
MFQWVKWFLLFRVWWQSQWVTKRKTFFASIVRADIHRRAPNMSKISSLPLILKRHSWAALATFASVVGTACVYLYTASPLYEASGRLMLDERRTSVSELGRALSEIPEGSQGSNPIATQAELVKSQRVLRRALDQVFPGGISDSDQPVVTPDQLSQDLQIKIVPATNILELNYRHPDPQVAANLLNAIADAMIQENVETIRREASSVRKFLEDRVPQQQARLEQAEAIESQYRQSSGVVSFEAQTSQLVGSLAEIENEERTVMADLRQAQTRDALLQQVTGLTALSSAYAAVRVGQDEGLRNLRTQLSDLEAKVIEHRSRLGERHPDLLAAVEQRDEMRSYYTQQLARLVPSGESVPASAEAADDVSKDLISQYIVGEVERTALEDRLRVVKTERQGLQSRILELPAKQQQLSALVRQREEAEATLKLLQGKLEEARIAEAQLVSNVQALDLAEIPSSPAVPNPRVVFVLAIVAGALLAAGVVALLEAMDNVVRSAPEVEAAAQLPVLSDLPKLESIASSPYELEHFLNDANLVEPYRLLLKTMEFRKENQLNVILISSALAGEGKSDLAARLAAVAAMFSRRTLLIDADLRQPIQHGLFNVAARPGLTDVIEGRKTLSEAVQTTGLENLSLLPHGAWLARPSVIVEAPSMKALISDAATRYDLVIIDTSPISLCVDAVTLSHLTDGLLFVARPDYTPKSAMMRAVTELKGSGTSILGIVLNRTSDMARSSDGTSIDRPQTAIDSLQSLTQTSIRN